MYRQIESDCGEGVTKLELVAALCDAGSVPRVQAEGMADKLLEGEDDDEAGEAERSEVLRGRRSSLKPNPNLDCRS